MRGVWLCPPPYCSSLKNAKFQVAVGIAVARHPPHRSVHAELPHTAPASGQTQWCLSGYGSSSSIGLSRSVERVTVSQHPVASQPLAYTALTEFRLTSTRIRCSRSSLPLASVCRSRSLAMNSPRPGAFSPRTPQVVGRFARLSTLVRSLHR